MIVVATSEDEVLGVRASLDELRVHVVKTVAAGESRLLVFAAVDDERQAEPIAVTLRAGGVMAVVRPDSGPSLDAWMRHTEPVRFGDRLSVCFAWSEYDRAGLSGLIELGPGGFGNGGHPATRLLVELLLERLAPGERVLDVGCGSGVLGLCALRLGAARVVAVDIKEAAIAATRRNAALNGMDQRVDAALAPLGQIEGTFDIVVANIGRGAIVELAPELVRLLAPGGWLALSGISPPQCSQVAGFLRPLAEFKRRTSGEWSALVVGHPGR
jgi:ribosomal protein L11 methyltransferase